MKTELWAGKDPEAMEVDKVFLDGEELEKGFVYALNTEEGWVLRYTEDFEDTERLEGKVSYTLWEDDS